MTEAASAEMMKAKKYDWVEAAGFLGTWETGDWVNVTLFARELTLLTEEQAEAAIAESRKSVDIPAVSV